MRIKGSHILRSFGVIFVLLCISVWEFPSLNGKHNNTSVPTVIRNVRVFDGERIIPQATVVIEGDKITAVSHKVTFPETAKVINGEGKTLLPGLFDAHVHVIGMHVLNQSLVFGVTTVIDMFMDINTMKNVKEMQVSGRGKDMAHLISAGTLATAPKGHGTQYGADIPTLTKPEEAQAFVDARVAEGSDFIKIIYDDGSAFGLLRATLSIATISAIIKAAHKRGKLVVIHAATLQNCIDALEAGADCLAHLYFNDAFDPEFGRLAARKKAFVIPTLSVLKSMSGIASASALTEDSHLSLYLKPMDVQALKQSFPFATSKAAYKAAEKALKQLKSEEVPILAGTDAPNPGTVYGASLHRELLLLVEAGLTPLEALKSATSIPAAVFNLQDRGRIQPGLLADLVLVEGDPTKDIKTTRNIVKIWKSGVEVERQKYLAEVEKAREAVELEKKVPPPKHSESGLISDFEGEKISAQFGAGWMISTDNMMGGKSTAKYQLVEPGAQGSKGAMLITGNVSPESSITWAGVLFSPGPQMMNPANLSYWKSLSFWAKGDNKTFTVMIFAKSLGFMPAMQTFVAGPEWKFYEFPWEKFRIEGYDIMGIFIGSSQEMGEFSLKIDNVHLLK